MVAAILNRPTLVLNRNWQPVGVATVAKALTKVWNDTARIVDPADYQQYTWDDWSLLRPADDDLFIQTRRFHLRVPEVVTLTKYDRLPTNAVTFSRRNVFKRDRFTCQYCGRQGRFVWNAANSANGSEPDAAAGTNRRSQPGSEELTIDHVIPRAQGGTSTWTNCVLACIECNAKKADRTPEQARMPLRSQPERPIWRPLYAARGVRIDRLKGGYKAAFSRSWSRFVSESYWNVEMQEK